MMAPSSWRDDDSRADRRKCDGRRGRRRPRRRTPSSAPGWSRSTAGNGGGSTVAADTAGGRGIIRRPTDPSARGYTGHGRGSEHVGGAVRHPNQGAGPSNRSGRDGTRMTEHRYAPSAMVSDYLVSGGGLVTFAAAAGDVRSAGPDHLDPRTDEPRLRDSRDRSGAPAADPRRDRRGRLVVRAAAPAHRLEQDHPVRALLLLHPARRCPRLDGAQGGERHRDPARGFEDRSVRRAGRPGVERGVALRGGAGSCDPCESRSPRNGGGRAGTGGRA